MIIDGHGHACGEYLDLDKIIAKMQSTRCDKIVLVPGEYGSEKTYDLPKWMKSLHTVNRLIKLMIRIKGESRHISKGNEYVHDIVQKSDGRVIQFLWVSKKEKNPKQYLDRCYQKWNFHGVKVHQCWDSFSIDSSFFKEIAHWAERNNKPLFVHLYNKKQARKLIEYKKDHPDLILIIAHLFPIEIFIKEKYQDANTYFDISPYQLTSTPSLEAAIDSFGAEKIILGSDTPYGKDALLNNIARVNSLSINDRYKNLIKGKNLAKILNI